MHQKHSKIKRLANVISAVVITCLVAAPTALAGPDEDESEAIDALRVTHLSSYPFSFVPGLGFVSANVEYSSNLGLKFLPPYMLPPTEVVREPNGLCSYTFTHADEQEYLRTNYLDVGFFSGWSSPYNNGSGDDPVWDELGAPRAVQHYNTDVFVSVSTRDKATGRIEKLGENPDDRVQDYASVRMQGGVNLLTWRGDTAVNPVMDYVPWHLISFPSKDSAKRATKTAGNAREMSKKLKFLQDLAEEAAEAGLPLAADYLFGGNEKQRGVYTEVKQRFVVVDLNAPEIHVDPSLASGFTPQAPYIVRAVDPGGSYFSSFSDEIMQYFSASDDCAFGGPVAIKPVLTPQVAGSQAPGNFFETNVTREIIIRANDRGPIVDPDCVGSIAACYTELKTNETTLSLWVRVEDHEPPLLIPPQNLVVEATPEMQAAGMALRANRDSAPGDPAYVDVGNPAVFDLGDRYPAIDGDESVTEFPVDRRTTINWTATDIADNSSGPKPQVITVKTPGTNATPAAFASAAETRVSEVVEILLTGNDPDVVDGVFDPLNFEIARTPDKGFLLAPPNPYFIEDYRRTWQEEAIPCEQQADDSIRFPKQISVTDSGVTYVLASQPRVCDARMQISAFDKDGDYMDRAWVHEDVSDFAVLEGENNAFDIPSAEVATAREPGIYFLTRGDRLEPRPTLWHWATDENGLFPDDDLFSCGQLEPGCHSWRLDDQVSTQMVTVDSRAYTWALGNRLGIYELRGLGNWSRLTDATQEPSIPIEMLNGDVVGNMATDSNDNLYVVEAKRGRVYKFDPAMSDPADPIKLAGWMGRCDSGENCDVENERSFGFSCTDDTCGYESFYDGYVADREAELVACGLPTPAEAPGDSELRLGEGEGCQPGQFNLPSKIEIDPNDNLYVADYANRRVQRFTTDGGFTGEAKSKCDGSCFVLGDFGRPLKMTVNSFGFYVLDEAKKLLHVFEASPFSEITADSAIVKYESNRDILGPQDAMATDTFDFTVNDGLASSAPFTVNVSVTRNYRAPSALPMVLVDGNEADVLTVTEDIPQDFVLQGSDPDTQDEDHLTFAIVTQPSHGSVIETVDGWRYIPDEHYFRDDTAPLDSFAFVASDAATSAQAMTSEPTTIQVDVTPEPDPVEIVMPDAKEAGIGFPVTLIADVTDVDSNAKEMLVVVDWDDGCVDLVGTDGNGNTEQEIQCRRSAPDSSNRTIGSISLTLAAGNPGTLIADHIYATPGARNVRVCIGDKEPGPVSPPVFDQCIGSSTDSVGEVAINVMARADAVAIFDDNLDRDENNQVIEAREAGVPTNVSVFLRNRIPSVDSTNGATSMAPSTATIVLDERLAFASVPVICNLVSSLPPAQATCPVPPLNPGDETPAIDFVVVADPALTEAIDQAISVSLAASAPEVDGGYFWATTLPFKSNPVLDPDGDGVPNSDDAFPSDPNEWTDTDSDGIGNNADRDDDGDSLSDSWENRYGLDSLNAADADADMDGDGLSNSMEAMQGTHPATEDSDRDGHNDEVDNCPVHFNQQQHDENDDFLGDACDGRSFAAAASVGDADGDSMPDMALLKTTGGASTVYVKGGATNIDIALIGGLAEPSRAETLLSLDGVISGPERALAFVYTDGTGDAHARTVNAWTGATLGDFPLLASGSTLVDAKVVGNAGSSDTLLFLGLDGNRITVSHRDARDGTSLHELEFLSAHHDSIALAAVGSDMATVLAVDSAGDLVLQTRTLADGALVQDQTVGRADMLRASLAAGAELLYTMTTSVAGESVVSVWPIAAAAPTIQFAVFDNTWMPLSMQFVGSAGPGALAISASNEAGEVEVRVYDISSGEELNTVAFRGTPDSPRALVTTGTDASLGTIAVLASDALANVSLEQRSATTGAQQATLTAASVTPPPPPPPPSPPAGGKRGGGAGGILFVLILIAALVRRRRHDLLASGHGSKWRHHATPESVDERQQGGRRSAGATDL